MIKLAVIFFTILTFSFGGLFYHYFILFSRLSLIFESKSLLKQFLGVQVQTNCLHLQQIFFPIYLSNGVFTQMSPSEILVIVEYVS